MALRRSILVVDDSPVERAHPARDRWGDLQLFAGGDDLAEPQQERRLTGSDLGQLLEGDKGYKQAFNRRRAQEPDQLRRISPYALGDQDQRPTRPPGREDLLKGDVEAQRRELQCPCPIGL